MKKQCKVLKYFENNREEIIERKKQIETQYSESGCTISIQEVLAILTDEILFKIKDKIAHDEIDKIFGQ